MDKADFSVNDFGFGKFDLNNGVPITPIDLHYSILSTHYFVHSWLLISEMNLIAFDAKLENLINKDKNRDTKWVPVTHIICFDTITKKSCLVEISIFRSIFKLKKEKSFEYLKQSFGKFIDFYIPRSVWWKSFLMLEKNLGLTTKKYLN